MLKSKIIFLSKVRNRETMETCVTVFGAAHDFVACCLRVEVKRTGHDVDV